MNSQPTAVEPKTAVQEETGSNVPRVFVAMSGGVDSSVAAALLKDAGYNVTGVFIRVWQPDFIECSRVDDREEAKRAAEHLDIPFLTFDLEEEYKRDVVDYMVSEYRAGRTPNPDVMCNKQIKFKAFLERARALGADYIATGHYARVAHDEDGNPHLFAGRDTEKDQSYFLWALSKEQLKYCLFPVGEYEKPRVRKLAREYNLPNADRRDSQGVCFIGKMDMRTFLKHYISETPGDVLNETGEVIGRHEGALFYTLGQRHGFEITKKTPETPPLYVVQKDTEQNTITVGPRRPDEGGEIQHVLLEKVNWISGKPEEGHLAVRYRYRQPLRAAEVATQDSGVAVHFSEGQNAVAPGQSLVFYRGDECLGGGIIARTR